MKVLVIGGGGREHAIVQALSESKYQPEIYCAPGNAGIASLASCVSIGAMDFEGLKSFALEQQIDLTIVGMDDPLVGGIVDVFREAGLRIFGPDKRAAILEGSKAFAKELMMKYDIPCAASRTFSEPEEAMIYLHEVSYPVVLKADGLALGKGVLICNTAQEAHDGIDQIMIQRTFGDAGKQIVIEEYLQGREVSVLTFVDGHSYRIMGSAQDHKRIGDGDTGLNTGGMGTFSPSPFYTEEIDRICHETVYQRTVDAMRKEDRPFKGVIFFGLMLTEDGPKVLEFNARFGDPEAQVLLPRMRSDLIDAVNACIDGTLDQADVSFDDRAAVCVVLASDGYPVSYEKGKIIRGLEYFDQAKDQYCFHAGTISVAGEVVTNGGRVLGVTAVADSLTEAREQAYKAAEQVKFDGKYLRHDIGKSIEEST
ncbi:MAG: phosphoribosylamine--glycine ligase [Lachnospiraceae bacterium]|nr:phosphoribosylamine--glycine ligase [Lachnospiraceae bacterium]